MLNAAKPWSKLTHSLFPLAVRKLAAALLRVGWDLSQQERFRFEEMAIFEVWREHVMPHAATRNSYSIKSKSKIGQRDNWV